VKALNDTIGPNNFSPTELGYGSKPRLPIMHNNHTRNKERHSAIKLALEESNAFIAKRRIKKVMESNVPPSANISYRIGDPVRIYNEQDKLWHSGYHIHQLDGEMLWVSEGYRITKLHRTHIRPEENNEMQDERNFMELLQKLKPLTEDTPSVLIFEKQDFE